MALFPLAWRSHVPPPTLVVRNPLHPPRHPRDIFADLHWHAVGHVDDPDTRMPLTQLDDEVDDDDHREGIFGSGGRVRAALSPPHCTRCEGEAAGCMWASTDLQCATPPSPPPLSFSFVGRGVCAGAQVCWRGGWLRGWWWCVGGGGVRVC
jgi:hypothetical protein